MNNASLVFTPAAQQAQAERGSAQAYAARLAEGFPDTVTADLAAFIAEQDTAFLGTANARTARPTSSTAADRRASSRSSTTSTLGFADYRGNRQYITLANLSENDRAFLFLLDPADATAHQDVGPRARGRRTTPRWSRGCSTPAIKAKPERAILFTIDAWDVNCPQHIVTRLTGERKLTDAFMAPCAPRSPHLQAENAASDAQLARRTETG